MKRHKALANLSRQHHGALILAQLLKKGAPEYKGLPVNISAKADYAYLFYRDELITHFLAEEQFVIKKLKGINASLDKLANEIANEHSALTILFTNIQDSHDLPTQLDTLGNALERHIRKEEREFFPMIEELCSEKLLREIEQALTV
jgi:hypothetical protein